MSDYKPANIDALARAIYQKQCQYLGPDHEKYCVEELKITLQSFEDEIHSLQQQLAEIAPDERIVELAQRLIASGPKCSHLSASECHEISDFIFALPLPPMAGGE